MAPSRLVNGQVEKSIEDATVALINSDPELREELRILIKKATRNYGHIIDYGAPDARLAAMKAIVPGLLRAMGRVEQSQEEAEMRTAYEEILNAEIAIFHPQPLTDLPADAPPVVKKKATRKGASTQ